MSKLYYTFGDRESIAVVLRKIDSVTHIQPRTSSVDHFIIRAGGEDLSITLTDNATTSLKEERERLLKLIEGDSND